MRDGIIAAAGDRAEVEAWIGDDTEVVDLAAGTLLPGFNDSHIHLSRFGAMIPPLSLDVGYPLPSVRSPTSRRWWSGPEPARRPTVRPFDRVHHESESR